MIRSLVHDPMFLAQKSVNAKDCPEDRAVIKDLLDTLNAHRHDCVGMAANMVGYKKNIIVVAMGMLHIAMVNPVIVSKAKPYETEEGCLSLLGGPRPVTRYEEIEVEYMDVSFRPHKAKFEGFTAQIIQHEVDHTKGILI